MENEQNTGRKAILSPPSKQFTLPYLKPKNAETVSKGMVFPQLDQTPTKPKLQHQNKLQTSTTRNSRKNTKNQPLRAKAGSKGNSTIIDRRPLNPISSSTPEMTLPPNKQQSLLRYLEKHTNISNPSLKVEDNNKLSTPSIPEQPIDVNIADSITVTENVVHDVEDDMNTKKRKRKQSEILVDWEVRTFSFLLPDAIPLFPPSKLRSLGGYEIGDVTTFSIVMNANNNSNNNNNNNNNNSNNQSVLDDNLFIPIFHM